MEWPDDGHVLIKSLSKNSLYSNSDFNKVELLGGNDISYSFDNEGLNIMLYEKNRSNMALVLKISKE